MANNCTPAERAKCPDPEVIPTPAPCPEWKLCLPFGASLESRNGCIYMVKGTPPPDGTYGKIVVQGGCIVDALPEDIALYTGPTCAPTPNPCGDGGGSGGGSSTPSRVAGNLFTQDPAGDALVLLYTRAGSGISITGDGTATNPLVISATATGSGSGGVYVVSGNSAIEVSGDGTAKTPYKISHHEAGQAQTIQGMSIDRYGHVIGYTAPTGSKGVTGVIGKDGITANVDVNTGIVTVSLTPPLPEISGTFLLGGYAVTLDKNKITEVSRQVTFLAGAYELGDYRVTVNEFGTITDIEKLPPKPAGIQSFSKHYAPLESDQDAGSRSIEFTTTEEASFHITYKCNVNIAGSSDLTSRNVNIKVDNQSYPAYFTGQHCIEALTPAKFAAGAHIVTIPDGIFNDGAGIVSTAGGHGFLNVTLVTVGA